MKRVLMSVAVSVLMIVIASVTVMAVVAPDNQANEREINMSENTKRIVPQDVIEEKYDESKYIHFDSTKTRDSSLDQKLSEFENQEAKENENDLRAYTIVNNYLNKSYSAKAIIDSKNEDCLFMKDIIKVMQQNKLTDSELATLNSYLSRRLVWLDKDTDKILIEEINRILYNPINAN